MFREQKRLNENLPPWVEQTQEEILYTWGQRVRANPRGRFLISDVDDTKSQTHRFWTEWLEKRYVDLSRQNGSPELSHRTWEELGMVGDPIGQYAALLGSEEYARCIDYLFFSEESNTLPLEIEQGISQWWEKNVFPHVEVLGDMTARPLRQDVREYTARHLLSYGLLPELPVVFRPMSVPWEKSGAWKRNVLLELQDQAPEAQFILTDDSLSTAEDIRLWNEDNPRRRPLIQAVYPGQSTVVKLQQRKEQRERTGRSDPLLTAIEERRSGMFLMSGWAKMDETLNDIDEWWHDQRNYRQLR